MSQPVPDLSVEAVVKVGGGLSAIGGALPRVGRALTEAARVARLVVIPGGGPFADAVREFDRRVGLSSNAAHWMAILAMDQYAYVIADCTPGARVVDEAGQIPIALRAGEIPVLAPFRWLRAADELPHGWEVTSDSLAAYLAGLLGASTLALIKPETGAPNELTDPYFFRALPANLRYECIGVEALDSLAGTLSREPLDRERAPSTA